MCQDIDYRINDFVYDNLFLNNPKGGEHMEEENRKTSYPKVLTRRTTKDNICRPETFQKMVF